MSSRAWFSFSLVGGILASKITKGTKTMRLICLLVVVAFCEPSFADQTVIPKLVTKLAFWQTVEFGIAAAGMCSTLGAVWIAQHWQSTQAAKQRVHEVAEEKRQHKRTTLERMADDIADLYLVIDTAHEKVIDERKVPNSVVPGRLVGTMKLYFPSLVAPALALHNSVMSLDIAYSSLIRYEHEASTDSSTPTGSLENLLDRRDDAMKQFDAKCDEMIQQIAKEIKKYS